MAKLTNTGRAPYGLPMLRQDDAAFGPTLLAPGAPLDVPDWYARSLREHRSYRSRIGDGGSIHITELIDPAAPPPFVPPGTAIGIVDTYIADLRGTPTDSGEPIEAKPEPSGGEPATGERPDAKTETAPRTRRTRTT